MQNSSLTIYYRCLCGQLIWYTTVRFNPDSTWSGWCHVCERFFKIYEGDHCTVNIEPPNRWETPFVLAWDYITRGRARRKRERLKGI